MLCFKSIPHDSVLGCVRHGNVAVWGATLLLPRGLTRTVRVRNLTQQSPNARVSCAGLHDHTHIMRTTQAVITCMRELLLLPTTKALAERNETETPRQLDASMACGYHTVWSFGVVLVKVLLSDTTACFGWGEYKPLSPHAACASVRGWRLDVVSQQHTALEIVLAHALYQPISVSALLLQGEIRSSCTTVRLRPYCLRNGPRTTCWCPSCLLTSKCSF